jgi:hypothetical protein
MTLKHSAFLEQLFTTLRGNSGAGVTLMILSV